MITEGLVSGSLNSFTIHCEIFNGFPSSSAEELDSCSAVCNALVQGSSAASLPPRTPPIHNLKSSPSVSSASLRASPPPRTPRDQSQGPSPRTGHLSLRPFSESATLSSSLQVLCTQERSPHHCHHSAPPSPPLRLDR